MLQHFRKFEHPRCQSYRKACVTAIATRPKLDHVRYQESRQSTPLMNVNYPSEIPLNVRNSLGIKTAVEKIEKSESLVKKIKNGLKIFGIFNIIKKLYKVISIEQRR
jgi:hypothetical protein